MSNDTSPSEDDSEAGTSRQGSSSKATPHDDLSDDEDSHDEVFQNEFSHDTTPGTSGDGTLDDGIVSKPPSKDASSDTVPSVNAAEDTNTPHDTPSSDNTTEKAGNLDQDIIAVEALMMLCGQSEATNASGSFIPADSTTAPSQTSTTDDALAPIASDRIMPAASDPAQNQASTSGDTRYSTRFTPVNRPSSQHNRKPGIGNTSPPARRPLPTINGQTQKDTVAKKEVQPWQPTPAAAVEADVAAASEKPKKKGAATQLCACSFCRTSNKNGVEVSLKTKKEHTRADNVVNTGKKHTKPCDRCANGGLENSCFFDGGSACSNCIRKKERCSFGKGTSKGRKRDLERVKQGEMEEEAQEDEKEPPAKRRRRAATKPGSRPAKHQAEKSTANGHAKSLKVDG
ncbi:hypothetical protein CORC01_11641 [Colletotrichum orchidophilum]|uniref:Uncharacterized protein n=1 Tax=Colletotrichum orchidophilum TaxID=1209926 RepID=A0A1G4AVB1_9PEZI|nr:uncharacterized protein CORC01_11641 [Colletotrichum orchidophilum]OHE93084.1 hypothetical protein CORC01_11641 [Colletotrichum orchidophilum]